MAQRKTRKKQETGSGFDGKYLVLVLAIIIVAAIGIYLIWTVTPKFSDNVAAEFGEYGMGVGYSNNYFAGACNEGDFKTWFYTMSGVTGRLTEIIIPITVQDDPDAEVVAEVRICEASLGGECIGDEVAVVSGYGFHDNWGFDSGDKELSVNVPFYVRSGAYYRITIEGNMNKPVVYSMYRAEVSTEGNRYFHTAPGCSSGRPDVYVVHFWAV